MPDGGTTDQWIRALRSLGRHPFLRAENRCPHPASGAAQILALDRPTREGLCVAARDKRVIAAALLAAATGGFSLLIPYATSPQVLTAACAEAGVGTVLTDDEDTELPRGLEALVLSWDEVAEGPTNGPLTFAPEHPFVWLYTGGTTAAPRIWAKTPRNLFGEAAFLAGHFGIGPSDHVLTTVPVQHIYGLLFSVAIPLVSGATTSNRTPFLPQVIRDTVMDEEATILVSSPIHYRAKSIVAPETECLRLAFSSGSPLAPTDAARFEQTTGLGITEVYGSTETGGLATRDWRRGEAEWRSLETTEWRLDLDRLLVRSPFLSPNLPLDAEGWFRTGDRAEALARGSFRLLGRADGVVKVGGRRVVLDKIREVILRVDGVRDAVVLGIPTDAQRSVAVAALYEGNADGPQVRRAVAELLEPYEQPRILRRTSSIPRRYMGKMDREQILALLYGGAEDDVEVSHE